MKSILRTYSLIKGALAPLFLSSQSRCNVGQVLQNQARKRPDQTLLIFENRRITYKEANARANQYARLMLVNGLRKGDTVALFMENRPEYLMIHAGLARIGVVPALVNTHLRSQVLAHAIRVADAKAVIVGSELVEAYRTADEDLNLASPGIVWIDKEDPELPTPDGMTDMGPLLGALSEADLVPPEPVTAGDTLEYIYTSGTTGMPKATVLTHRKWFQLGYSIGGFAMTSIPGDVHYLCLPLYHNSGVNLIWSQALLWGGTIAMRRRFSASKFWDDIRKHRVNRFVYVGELCRYLYNQPPLQDDADNPLEVILGNGMRAEYWEAFQRRFSVGKIIEVYGATEGVGGLINRKGVPGMIGQLSVAGLVRMGEVARCDPETGDLFRNDNGFAEKCRTGETGMFLARISRLNQFSGYKNNRLATNEKLIRDVFKPGDAYFISGDLMQLHENDFVSFVDRLGDTFKWKGEVVSTNEVGDLLFRFGGIEDANVYGVTVAHTEGRAGMAALTLLPGVDLDLKAFFAYVTENLPAYARPLFVRIRKQADANASFKQLKGALKKEGFDPERVSDPLYFLDADSGDYRPLSSSLYAEIQSGTRRL